MTAAVQAVLEQAKRLTAEERAELASALRDLDAPHPPALARDELDRQLAESLAEVARGEVIDEEEVRAELNAL
jgi:hypothetical protein